MLVMYDKIGSANTDQNNLIISLGNICFQVIKFLS